MGNDHSPGRTQAPQTPGKASTPTGTGGESVGKRTQVGPAAGDRSGADSASHASPGGIYGLNLMAPAPSAAAPDLTVHAPEELGDTIANFRIALDKGDAEGAQLSWSFATPAEKRQFGQSSTINRELVTIARVTGPLTIHVMAEAGLDFTGRADLIDYMLKIGFPHWFDSLDEVGGTLMATFLANLPQRDALDDKALAKLDRIINGMNSIAILKPLFERIYVPLSDASYNTKKLRTAPWFTEAIHRLYKVLREHLPTAHVRTVKSFHLGREKKEAGEWKKVTNAWWNSGGYVVLPEKNAKAEDGGGREHRMTGGTKAHADPETGKGKAQGAMDRFDVGALHEVGHAVGDSLGGHKWAHSYPFVDWQTNLTVDAWSKGLWGNDVALTVRAKHKSDGDKAIASADARHFLANELLGNGTVPPGWEDPDKYKSAILKQYGDQPLATYFKKCEASDDQKDWYRFSGTQNYGTDGRVYVYLSRGKSGYSSYNQEAHKQMVSWYSLSSPHEWFAEQYAHYYRMGKSGEGLEGGVAKKLAELDTQQPPPQPDAPAAGAAAPSEDYDLEGEATEHRVPFPW